MINKLYRLREHIPDNLVDESQYGLTLADREETVLVLEIETDKSDSGGKYVFRDCHSEKYSRSKNETKFFFKQVKARGTSEFPTVFLSYEDLSSNESYFSEEKSKGKLITILQKYKDQDIKAVLSALLLDSELIRKVLLEKMDGRKNDKELYILTISIDGEYIGESKLFEKVRDEAGSSLLSPYFTLTGKKEIKPKNKTCSVCLKENKEVWGYVSTFNFYTAKTEFATIAGGFNKSDAWKNYPVCPKCAVKLKESKSILEKYMKYYFCGFSYFLIPEFLNSEKDNSEIMDIFLDKETALGKFSLNEDDRKKITNSEGEILDIIKETDNHVNYTMFFFEANNNEFKILLTIEDVYPSQFKTIFKAKENAENYKIFKGFENKKDNTFYNLSFRFNHLNEFLPLSKEKALGNSQVFKKHFLEIVRSVFLQKKVSYKFLLHRIIESIRRKHSNEEFYPLSFFKILLTLKFFHELGVINLANNVDGKEVVVEAIYQKFFAEHSEFFDNSAKKAVFLEGVLCQKLLNVQYRERNATPFRTKLNGLKINPKLVVKLFPEIIEKLSQYEKNHFYLDLEKAIADLLLESKLDDLSNDEISFYFVMGMTLHKEFKKEKEKSEDN